MKQHHNPHITVIGIDPGYDRLGWSIGTIGTDFTLVAAGCIQTDSAQPIFSRYQTIMTELEKILQRYSPQEAAIETLYFSKNTTTALRVSESRGIVIGSLLTHNCHVFEYNPVEIKQAVSGNGAANKQAVEKMVRMQVSLPNNQKLVDDAIDAIAVGITHAVKGRVTKMLSRLA